MYPTNYPNYEFRYPVIPSFGQGQGMTPMTPMTPMQQGMQGMQGMQGSGSPITPIGGRPPVAAQGGMGTAGTQAIPGTPTTQVTPGPGDFNIEPATPVTDDVLYTQGWLKTQIGQKVKIEFLIGTNTIQDRDGTLLDVGISYVLINETETDDILMCDIYSIKFVRVYK